MINRFGDYLGSRKMNDAEGSRYGAVFARIGMGGKGYDPQPSNTCLLDAAVHVCTNWATTTWLTDDRR
jgi:hypothetical protein